MKIAIVGSRGYPYNYGGYETFVKEICERLVASGVEVHVYNQKNLFKNRPKQVNGVNLHYIPTVPGKSLNQLIHSFLSLLHVTFTKVDVILVVNLAAGPMGWIPKLTGKKTMINTDGMEWLRPKWKGLGAKYFYFGAWCATKLYDKIITDADAMQKVYLEEFNTPSTVIAYGAPPYKEVGKELIEAFGVQKNEYYLIVGRLIPDNNADLIVKGFLASNSTKKLVVVGDVPYKDTYAQDLKKLGNDRLIFTGHILDRNIVLSFFQHCFVYLHGHQFGGTNPTMIEAMSNRCAILALNTPFNREMLNNGEFGILFDKDSTCLTQAIEMIETSPDKVALLRKKLQTGLINRYNWDVITRQYISEFEKLTTGSK